MSVTKSWTEVAVGNRDHTKAAVVIIGSGMSGICMAIDLIKRNNCRNFVILEKSSAIGGTWNDNKYPGCCCDIWGSLYSFSFAQKTDWTREYPSQEEILAYLTKTAQDYNLYQHIRFNSTVEAAHWDDETSQWRTTVTVATGSKDAEFIPQYEITSEFLVSAVGQLNQPRWPEEIEGINAFTGKKMHSARWDWSYDLEGKNIALLGNGCTAVQILPELQKVAKHITVFQRTPNWLIPRLDVPIPAWMRTVYKYCPPLLWRKRAGQMSFREDSFAAIVDPRSNQAQDLREQSTNLMRSQMPGRPDLWRKLTPKYNVGCKRIILSDDYFPSLVQPNVTLETRPIVSMNGNLIKVKDESGGIVDSHDHYDLLVCATGFKTVEFMHPISMYGRRGRSIRDVWKEGARAYKGISVEDMPNFGMMYGPNTNLGHNSIIVMIEAQSRYLSGLIGAVLDARRDGKPISLCPKKERVDEYNQTLQAALGESSFNDPSCNSWYKNKAGLITNNWSTTAVDYQNLVSVVNLQDYDVGGDGAERAQISAKISVGRVKEEAAHFHSTWLAIASVIGTVAVAFRLLKVA